MRTLSLDQHTDPYHTVIDTTFQVGMFLFEITFWKFFNLSDCSIPCILVKSILKFESQLKLVKLHLRVRVLIESGHMTRVWILFSVFDFKHDLMWSHAHLGRGRECGVVGVRH